MEFMYCSSRASPLFAMRSIRIRSIEKAQWTLETSRRTMALAVSLRILFALLRTQFLLIMCKKFYDYVQVKTLIWLQKPSAGRDEKLIANLMNKYFDEL